MHLWQPKGGQLLVRFHKVRDSEMPFSMNYVVDIRSLGVATVSALRRGFLPIRQKEQSTHRITARDRTEFHVPREGFRISNEHAFVPLLIGNKARALASRLAQM